MKKVGTKVNKGGWNRWNNDEPEGIFRIDKKNGRGETGLASRYTIDRDML